MSYHHALPWPQGLRSLSHASTPMNTLFSKIHTRLLLSTALLAVSLLSLPAHAGLKEGLAAYDKADYASALKELEPLAKKGNAQAQNKLGRMFGLGQGVAKDPRASAEWFNLAAEQGVLEAQSALGYMYLMGEGAPQDNIKAIAWTRKAAEKGDVMAQYNLAVMHGEEYGIKKNPAESLKWLRKAAEQGHADAQNALGVMYREGKGGVHQDLTIAYMLFDLAAAQGKAPARDNRTALETKMTPTQISKGKELASRWKRKSPLPN